LNIASLRRTFAVIIVAIAASAQGAAAMSSQPIVLDTPSGQIAGTLLTPSGGDRVPVALIIAGSGPTDRNGNSSLPFANGNNSLMLLAQALAEAGIATVRYDKRGIAGSVAAGPSEAEMRIGTFVDDASGGIDLLVRDPRFSSVVVIGHSEGALIGMLAAQNGKVGAFVSIAGAGRGIGQILRQQLAGKLPPDLAADNERILSALERGQTDIATPPALAALYRPSVLPYLASVFKHDPAQRLAQLAVPILIVQGTTDIQVPVSDAQALKLAQPRAQLALIAEMNHVLKTVPSEPSRQSASYSDPALPLAPELITTLVAFLKPLNVK
jgi:pimeloyl-ACP methyl ester carboxylesterase